MAKQEIKAVSDIIGTLPEDISSTRFYSEYQAALRGGIITAVPIADPFDLGRTKCQNDLVKINAAFEQWYVKTIRALQLSRTRHGVVAHADDVLSGEVDFEKLAAQYRDQLNRRVSARNAVKRLQPKPKRGKPELTDGSEVDQVAERPQSIQASAQQREGSKSASTGEN